MKYAWVWQAGFTCGLAFAAGMKGAWMSCIICIFAATYGLYRAGEESKEKG